LVTASFRACEIVDAFLETEFKSGWDPEIQDFLDRSMTDIGRLERDAFREERD
jgi:hypothetical protein